MAEFPDTPLGLEYPWSLATYDSYGKAQADVDYLADHEFPVENCMIVGTELKQIERVTGRLTYGRAAVAGLGSGAWFGLLAGLLLGIFASNSGWLVVVLGSALIGALFGAVFAVVAYAMSGGRRDFTSVTQVVPSKFEVLVEHKHLARAQEMLSHRPGDASAFGG